MSSSLFIDAVGFLGEDLIENYLAMRDDFSRKRAAKKALWKITGVTAACLAVVLLSFFALRGFGSGPGDNPACPEIWYRFSLGEICESTDSDNSVVLDHAYLTREIAGERRETGGYLIVTGVIDAQNYTFVTDQINLDLRLKKYTDEWDVEIRFEKELSETLSEIELVFVDKSFSDDEYDWFDWLVDGAIGTMKGRFCFVFSIDENDYFLIESKTSQTSFYNDQGYQITVDLGIYWSSGFAGWSFMTNDVENLEKFN